MLTKLIDSIKDIFASRLRVMISVMVIFSGILILRLFVLQIIRGNEYQSNYDLMVEKTETIDATRGNIYDRKGQLLAYNELAYAVTIEDTGSYQNSKVRNKELNEEISQIITNIEANGDSIDNEFGIILNAAGEFEFVNSGTSQSRFLADIFGHASINDLTYNKNLKLNEAEATPDQVMNYLWGDRRYQVSSDYNKELRYKIAIVRYNMGQNSYQKYIATTIASDVSDKTVAYIKEHANELTGCTIAENSVRRYVDSEYFAHIIGYTGQISTEEYNELKSDDNDYSLTDVIGKSGIEQDMNEYLSGTKGSETVFVDSVGNLIEVTKHTDTIPGNDVYLSIDKDLQEATYKLLEREIASILYSKIVNTKAYNSSSTSKASDIVIPIYDVYYALVENHLIDVSALDDADATDTERAVKSAYDNKKNNVLNTLKSQLTAVNPTAYNKLDEEYQDYSTYIVTMLKSSGIFDANAIDSSDDIQKQWKSEQLSVADYLTYAIEQNWIDITKFSGESKYADTQELYSNLVEDILTQLDTDSGFQDLVYKYVIYQDYVTGNQLCTILYDQGVLPQDDSSRNGLASGSINAYSFLKGKIQNLEITPGQLALDPCSGSSVILDTKTGEVLACVTYPGYDNNKLANSVDSKYYSSLLTSMSNPMYNNATQQRTAPGSTFKMVSATAGLAEGVITTTSTIQDQGIYENVSNKPKCWYYPNTHGVINVSQAIRDSCNYFFYEVGDRLAGGVNNYNDATGISKITKYASLYGLDSKTGVEIEENQSSIATEYPVMAAIGQSNNNYTTIALARYVTAVANNGTVYNLSLLDKVTDKEGNTLMTYGPSVKNQVDVLNSSEWSAIHSGMRMVVENLSVFDTATVNVAGKTGTAEVNSRPNHALFVGYAPYENPEIAMATRIAYGYTSHNAAAVSKDIIEYYFHPEDAANILNGQVGTVNTTNTVAD